MKRDERRKAIELKRGTMTYTSIGEPRVELSQQPQVSSLSGELIPADELSYYEPLTGRRLTLNEYEVNELGLRDVSAGERKRLAKKGHTFSSKGNYPIANCGDVSNARKSIGRSRPQDRGALRAYINRRAKALGCNVSPL